MKRTVILFGVFLLCHQGQSDFIDSIRIPAFRKPSCWTISDEDIAAWRIQADSLNAIAVEAQIESLIHLAQEYDEAPKETQEIYANNLVEMANSLPVVDHNKSDVHIALGEEEKGETIIKGATSSAGAVIGVIQDGPAAGADLGGPATDALISGIDGEVHEEFKSHGTVISGDADGARKTKENFVNTAVLLSRMKSAVHAAQGGHQAAKETQKMHAENLAAVAKNQDFNLFSDLYHRTKLQL
ncbi:hypothetical protein GE061_017943 [Apolygus lucorum]|uniref:SXP/RAL-2 family protein Ani s 5-like cation-binding domain-containing protein n=1 Tax=Apolygus lucorum TaxID=248454 RepID=A0A8S9XCG9_APOLU|nr:hypothetical protein GE061_017943 [Apolygus lucorum]